MKIWKDSSALKGAWAEQLSKIPFWAQLSERAGDGLGRRLKDTVGSSMSQGCPPHPCSGQGRVPMLRTLPCDPTSILELPWELGLIAHISQLEKWMPGEPGYLSSDVRGQTHFMTGCWLEEKGCSTERGFCRFNLGVMCDTSVPLFICRCCLFICPVLGNGSFYLSVARALSPPLARPSGGWPFFQTGFCIIIHRYSGKGRLLPPRAFSSQGLGVPKSPEPSQCTSPHDLVKLTRFLLRGQPKYLAAAFAVTLLWSSTAFKFLLLSQPPWTQYLQKESGYQHQIDLEVNPSISIL